MFTGHVVLASRRGNSCTLLLLMLCGCVHAQTSGANAADLPAHFQSGRLTFAPAPRLKRFMAADEDPAGTCTTLACAMRPRRLAVHSVGGLGFVVRDGPQETTSPEQGASAALPETAGRSAPPSAETRLNLHPLTERDFELRPGLGALSYSSNAYRQFRQGQPSRGIKYSLYLDECVRMEGLYGRSQGLDRYGVGIAKENWSVALAGGASDRGLSLQVGYSIPLGTGGGRPGGCGGSD